MKSIIISCNHWIRQRITIEHRFSEHDHEALKIHDLTCFHNYSVETTTDSRNSQLNSQRVSFFKMSDRLNWHWSLITSPLPHHFTCNSRFDFFMKWLLIIHRCKVNEKFNTKKFITSKRQSEHANLAASWKSGLICKSSNNKQGKKEERIRIRTGDNNY